MTDSDKQPLAERGNNRSHTPKTAQFAQFIGEDWGERPAGPARGEAADYVPARHDALLAAFPDDVLVIPAGNLKVRNNDCDYRFRATAAFAHMTGLGAELEPEAVLVLDASAKERATLYFHPRTPRTDSEFYADSRYGEFWVGARPSLQEMETLTGIHCEAIAQLRADLAAAVVTRGRGIRLLAGADPAIDSIVQAVRLQAGVAGDQSERDADLAEALSELRLRKDTYEIGQMQKAVDATFEGFDEIIASLPRAQQHHRGERVVEGAFNAKAREEGNGLGYDTIAAAGEHANTLHYMTNDGQTMPGDLILVDAGIEVDSLYTADITRTLPINGTFSPVQAQIYQTVLDACEAALEAANKPGAIFRDVHDAAMDVIAHRLEEWGILPGTAEVSLTDAGGWHRRWMPHGTSHHLGLDVHDCAEARRSMYMDGKLEPGMVFTIEPGLYFHADDLKVPEEFRGIGVRIEDDVVVRENGRVERLSEKIPRTIADVEAWMKRVLDKH
ncbi:MAG: aminopeptidase P family protein [Actinomycetaceae bacterium]|nr:aminopeptidase P family protein [Actinomycetaceae bacterium]MDY6082386.1 aminopeptidase P family protein [Actinomycetaceae bacterium]